MQCLKAEYDFSTIKIETDYLFNDFNINLRSWGNTNNYDIINNLQFIIL